MNSDSMNIVAVAAAMREQAAAAGKEEAAGKEAPKAWNVSPLQLA